MDGGRIFSLAGRPLPRGSLRLAGLAIVVAGHRDRVGGAPQRSRSRCTARPLLLGTSALSRAGIRGGRCRHSRWRFSLGSRCCAPRACPRGRSSCGAFALALGSRLGLAVAQRGEREWWWPLVRPNSRVTEYPAAYPFVRGHVLAFVDHFAESVPMLPVHPSGHPVGATLAFFGLDSLHRRAARHRDRALRDRCARGGADALARDAHSPERLPRGAPSCSSRSLPTR